MKIGEGGQSERKEQIKEHSHERRERTVWCDGDPLTCHTARQINQPNISPEINSEAAIRAQGLG